MIDRDVTNYAFLEEIKMPWYRQNTATPYLGLYPKQLVALTMTCGRLGVPYWLAGHAVHVLVIKRGCTYEEACERMMVALTRYETRD